MQGQTQFGQQAEILAGQSIRVGGVAVHFDRTTQLAEGVDEVVDERVEVVEQGNFCIVLVYRYGDAQEA